MDRASRTKFTAARNIIRKKFKKACLNRIDRERESERALETLSVPQHASSPPSDLHVMNHCKRYQETQNESNELCERLRTLIDSRIAGDVNQTEEINAIIKKLRKLEIIA